MVGEEKIFTSDKDIEEAVFKGEELKKEILFVKNDIGDISRYKSDCNNDNINNIEVISYTANKIELKSNNSCSGFLSTSEIYYPGWEAKIDGKMTRVYRSNLTFRAIYLPGGLHEIEFYYNPRVYFIGGLISFITVISVLFFKKICGKKIQ